MGAFSSAARVGRTRRLALPQCACGAPLTRKAKNAGHVICAACVANLRDQMARQIREGAVRWPEAAAHEAGA
jgi:hypothetical protein